MKTSLSTAVVRSLAAVAGERDVEGGAAAQGEVQAMFATIDASGTTRRFGHGGGESG